MHNLLRSVISFACNYKYLIACILIPILLFILYKILKGTKRITSIKDLPKDFRNMKMKGYVTQISDGDGFHFFHTPCGRRRLYRKGDHTLKIRLAGVDAPEVRKFSKPAQPYAKEAKDYLKVLIYKRNINIKILSIDIYNRILASVWVIHEEKKINVGIKLVEVGLACIYEGKNAEYDGCKEILVKYEKRAREKRWGMWNQKDYVSPQVYKNS